MEPGEFKDAAADLQKMKQALLGVKTEWSGLLSSAYAYNKALGQHKTIIDKMQGDYFAINSLVGRMDDRILKIAKSEQQLEFFIDRQKNIRENNLEIVQELVNVEADLLKQKVAMQTSLTGIYASQAAELNLMMSKGVLSEEEYNREIKRLQAQQSKVADLQTELELNEEIAAQTLEIREEAEKYKKGLDKILATARAIGNDPKTMGAFMLTQGVKALGKFTEGFKEFQKQGLTAGQAIDAQFKGMDLMSMMGLSDAKGVTSAMVEQFGNVNALSRDTTQQLGRMAVEFGISGQEAGALNAAMSTIPGETSESAANAMEMTGHLAEMQGIAPGKIMKDMAKNTGEMARAGSKGAEEFGKSVVNLHKMGVEMSTASKIAGGLLDFESSITDQMEASVLLGREINLDKARELALNNDIEGMTKEIANNIGGSAEFGKMNRLQQDALAKSVGMSVEELTKMMDAQEESNKYFGEGAGLAMNAMGTILKVGSAAGGFLKENGLLLMSTLQFLTSEGALRMKNFIAEKAHFAWKKGAAALGFGKGGGAGDKAKDLSSKLKKDGTLDMRFKENKIPKDLGATNKVPDGAGKSTGGLTKAIEKINPGKLLAGAAALVLVAAAVFVFAKAAQEFMSVSWEAIAKAIVSMLALVGALALIGAIMSGPVGLFILAGAAAMLIMAAALYVLGKAIQEIAKGFEIVGPVLVSLAPMAMDIVALGAGLALMGYGMIALGLASWIAAPGLMLAAFGLNLMLPAAMALNALAESGGLIALGEAFMMIAAAAPGLLGVAAAMAGIGVGLGLVALAGFAAIPVFGAMMALAAVAPMLASLGSMFGGGEDSAKDDGMKVVADKLDQLIAVVSQGGVINMDGKKVGDVIGLSVSNARIA